MCMYTKLLFRLFYTFYVLVMDQRRDMLRYLRLHMQVLQCHIAWEDNYQRLARRLMRESDKCVIFLLQTASDLDEESRRLFIHMRQQYEVSPVFFKNLNR